jgi:hypothetical protein
VIGFCETLLAKAILPSKAVVDRQFIVPYVSRRLIFHGLIPTDKNKGEAILRHKRKVQVSCLNFCVAWAITLIEPRSALFTFYGRLILFLSITKNPTVKVTPGRLLLKNCSNWACISDFDGPTEVRGRRLLLERVD